MKIKNQIESKKIFAPHTLLIIKKPHSMALRRFDAGTAPTSKLNSLGKTVRTAICKKENGIYFRQCEKKDM